MMYTPVSPPTVLSTDGRSPLLDDPSASIIDPDRYKAACPVQIPIQWQRHIIRDCGAAQSSIFMTALSMLPPRASQSGPWPDMWATLNDRAAAGIAITLTMPAPSRAHTAAAQNTKAAATAHAKGWHVALLQPTRLLHAKQIIIDRSIIWIGSANLTAAAWAHNHERFVRVESPHFAERLIAAIPTNLATHEEPTP